MDWKRLNIVVGVVGVLILLVFCVACARMKIVHPGSLNEPRVVNAVTADQKFGVSFGFVQKIETSRESTKDLYLSLNKPQALERLDKTKSLELRIWIFNPQEAPYILQKAVCKKEATAIACAAETIYQGRDAQKAFQLEAPLTEPGTTKIIRALLIDKRGFPSLIIGDGIYIVPKKEVAAEKERTVISP